MRCSWGLLTAISSTHLRLVRYRGGFSARGPVRCLGLCGPEPSCVARPGAQTANALPSTCAPAGSPSVPKRGLTRAASGSAARRHSPGDLHPLDADDFRLLRDTLFLGLQVVQTQPDDVLDVFDHFLIGLALGIAGAQDRALGHVVASLISLDNDLEHPLSVGHVNTPQSKMRFWPRLRSACSSGVNTLSSMTLRQLAVSLAKADCAAEGDTPANSPPLSAGPANAWATRRICSRFGWASRRNSPSCLGRCSISQSVRWRASIKGAGCPLSFGIPSLSSSPRSV